MFEIVSLLVLGFSFTAQPVMAQRAPPFPGGRVVDLTYAFDASSVYWPTAESFKLETDFEGVTDKGYFYSAYRYSRRNTAARTSTRQSISRREGTPSIRFRSIS